MCEYYTHKAGGLLAGALVLQMMNAPAQMWPGALVLAVVASAIPDLDHNQSTAQSVGFNELKNNVPVAGNIITHFIQIALKVSRKFLGKRGATHSLLMAALIWWGMQMLWPSIPPPISYTVAAGYLSHLAVDMFNPEGVRLFWPVGPKISLARVLPWPFTFKTGSRIEKFVFRPALWISSMWIIIGKSLISNIH
ncbi:MAG: metal-dependent hydrolase [Firmicutes bacterium]|nr:metal-dependent hydrolase [Bacillota bacterium]